MRFFSLTRKAKPKRNPRDNQLEEMTNQELHERLKTNLSRLTPTLAQLNPLLPTSRSKSKSRSKGRSIPRSRNNNLNVIQEIKIVRGRPMPKPRNVRVTRKMTNQQYKEFKEKLSKRLKPKRRVNL